MHSSLDSLPFDLCPLSTSWHKQKTPDLQMVTGTTPSTRGKLPTPDTPRDCPADIWDLVQQCLMLKPEDRPSAKEVRVGRSLCTWHDLSLVLLMQYYAQSSSEVSEPLKCVACDCLLVNGTTDPETSTLQY